MPEASPGGEEVRASVNDARTSGTASANDTATGAESIGSGRYVTFERSQVADVTIDRDFDGYATTTFITLDGRTWVTREPVAMSADGQTFTARIDRVEVPAVRRRGDIDDWTSRRYEMTTLETRSQYARGGEIRGGFIPGCGCSSCVGRRDPHGRPLAGAALDEDWQYYASERRARQEREQTEREQRRQAAEVRAEETLRMVLLPDELANYEQTGRIEVTGSDKRRYRINAGIVTNVQLLDARGNAAANLCCHPDMYPRRDRDRDALPYKDAHIAQVLWLRYDLERFWKTANVYWVEQEAELAHESFLMRAAQRLTRTNF